MIWIQFIILLAMILIGSQMKGVGLGVMGMLGMVIFVFGFGMKPPDPPIDVMLIILAIVTTAATMHAAGGLDYLVSIAEKIIRSNPSRITFIAPLTVYCLCLFAGTSHVVYSLLPIIAEVSARKRIRPERPLSISVIASHIALTGSPMSAATAAFAAILAYPGASVDIMKICIPACITGVIAGAISVWKKGKELDNDPEFLEKMKDPHFAMSIDTATTSHTNIKPGARTAVFIFGIAILLIVLFGAFHSLIPNVGAGKDTLTVNADGSLRMPAIIEMIALAASGMIIIITKTKAIDVTKSSLFVAMATAVTCVFGVVWMSSTFMSNNQQAIQNALGGIAQAHPWTFAFAVFLMGSLMFSQAATTRVMMPLGLTLGIVSGHLIPMFPAVNADFVLPGYPTLLAATNFDRTGTTKIGRYVIDHSFMLPGLVAITTAIVTGFLLSSILL